MKANLYKLAEYKIIESDSGELTWEAHSGFGALQEGRCFRKGRILFIGQAENDRPGRLKAEFLDQLKPLPIWPKTKYYCKGFEIYHCKTGKRVTRGEMLLWTINRGLNEGSGYHSKSAEPQPNNFSTGGATEDASFRLQNYEIIKRTTGQVVWKTNTALNTVSYGACIFLEDILFIGPAQNQQTKPIGRDPRANLRLLPKWDQTKYYCTKRSLHDCKTGNRIQEDGQGLTCENMETETNDAGGEHSIVPEIDTSHGSQRGINSARTVSVFNSSAKFLARLRGRDRFSRLKSQTARIYNQAPDFRAHYAKKLITYPLAFVLLIKSLCLDLLSGYRKKRH